MSDVRHYGEELQDLLDGRLAEPHRSEIVAHVEGCARCRRELDALRFVKMEVPRHVGDAALPPELSARVRAGLDEVDRRSRRRIPRRVSIAGALAAAALLLLLFRGPGAGPLPSLVAADFAAYDAGAMRLDIESGDPAVVEAHFARHGIGFETRVFDLGMMQYQLVGGRVHDLDGRVSALFAYRGPGDTSLVCQMFEGSVSDLPPTADVREHNGITFYVYQMDNLTMVFWQEGEVVCVLTSDAGPEDVVQLAFAKAVRVDGPASD